MLDDGRRRELLAAIGIDVYCLRATAGAVEEAAPAYAAARVTRAVIACPAGTRSDAKLAKPFAHLVRALGLGADDAAWVETDGDRLKAALPNVSCYLMLGATAARACSAQLSLEQQTAATIAVAAESAEAFGDGPARRALWHAIKPLVRRLRTA